MRAQHEENRRRAIAQLDREYGSDSFEQKLKNFEELGPKSFSVFDFHNDFLEQARHAFVVGAYYPAATAACALGERILNHLIRRLRGYFTATPEYKRLHGKESLDDWDLAVSALEAWGVLLPKAAADLRHLARIRHFVLHFNLETDLFDRELGLACLKRLDDIVATQFAAIGPQPWFIPNAMGEAYIRKESESEPFVKEVYLPNCSLVGPLHDVSFENGLMVAHDTHEYDNKDVTDAEFLVLRKGGC